MGSRPDAHTFQSLLTTSRGYRGPIILTPGPQRDSLSSQEAVMPMMMIMTLYLIFLHPVPANEYIFNYIFTLCEFLFLFYPSRIG